MTRNLVNKCPNFDVGRLFRNKKRVFIGGRSTCTPWNARLVCLLRVGIRLAREYLQNRVLQNDPNVCETETCLRPKWYFRIKMAYHNWSHFILKILWPTLDSRAFCKSWTFRFTSKQKCDNNRPSEIFGKHTFTMEKMATQLVDGKKWKLNGRAFSFSFS
jgi:hypothetical protein